MIGRYMAETNTYIQREFKGDDGSVVTVYSNDGKRKTAEEFDKAIQNYSNTGSDSKGFVTLQPGVLSTMRSAYESVNQPMQQGVPKFTGEVARNTVAPITSYLSKIGLISPETDQSIQDSVKGIGEGVGRFGASTVSTPQQALGTLGTVAGAVASGGTSLLPQIAATGLGGAAGYLAGGALTGDTPTPGDVMMAGAMAAASQGFGEILKTAVGMSTSRLAEKQVASKLMELVKGRYGNTSNPGIVEMLGSNPADVARLTNVGIDAITSELKAVVAQLKPDMTANLPHTLSKGAQNTLRAQLRVIDKATDEYLKNIGKGGAETYFQDSVNDATKSIQQLMVNEFGKLSKDVQQKAVNQVTTSVQNYLTQLEQYKPGANMLSALRDSSAQNGFNAKAFQETLQSYQQVPGSFMDEVGDIARRGAPFSDVDRNYRVSVPIGKMLQLPRPLRNFSVGKNVGTNYAGKVEGTLPTLDAFGSVAGAQAIREFLDRRR